MSLERSSDIYLLAVGFLARGSGTPSERLISACEDFLDTLQSGELPSESLRGRHEALLDRIRRANDEPIGDEDARLLIDEVVLIFTALSELSWVNRGGIGDAKPPRWRLAALL